MAPTLEGVTSLCGDTGPQFGPHEQGDLLVCIFGNATSGDLASRSPYVVSSTNTSGYPVDVSGGIVQWDLIDAEICTHSTYKNEVQVYAAEAPATYSALNYDIRDDFGNYGGGGVLAELVIRGHDPANPFDVIAGACSATSGSSITIPGVTTTVDDTLVIHVVHTIRLTGGSGTAESISSWSNGTLASFGQAWQAVTGSSPARATAGTSGVMGTAGATGNVTATNTRTDRFYAYMTFAIAPGGPATRGWTLGAMTMN